jgi:hypothetical protein
MLQAQENYKNLVALILASLLAGLVVLSSWAINFSKPVISFAKIERSDLIFSNFLVSILANPSDDQAIFSLRLLIFSPLFSLIYKIYKDYNLPACIKFFAYIEVIFLLNNQLNNSAGIFFFISFVGILNSYIVKLRFTKIVFLVFSILLCPIFSILCVGFSYLIIKIYRLNPFHVYSYDLVIIDSILISSLLLFIVYGIQTMALIANYGPSPIAFIINLLLFSTAGLTFQFFKKSYEI